MLTEPYWTDSLHYLADTCEAPVLICGVAGKSRSTFVYGINDGGDGIALDTGFSFILVGDLMTLTKE